MRTPLRTALALAFLASPLAAARVEIVLDVSGSMRASAGPMSRMEAAGRRRRRWTCNNRDCDWTQPPREAKPNACPKCGNKRLAKRWVQLKDGKIDFDAVRRQLQEAGIELRGGAADEAPAAYKRLDEVLADHGDTIRVIHRLRPVGVAMAGPDVFDPYKD